MHGNEIDLSEHELQITINMSGAAFADGNACWEIIERLHQIENFLYEADPQIIAGYLLNPRALFDTNGARCGEVKVQPTTERNHP